MLADLASATRRLVKGEGELVRGIMSLYHSEVGISGLPVMSEVDMTLRVMGAVQLSSGRGQRPTASLGWRGLACGRQLGTTSVNEESE